jgi:hypothetical protein
MGSNLNSDPAAIRSVIWGTTVIISQVMATFRDFLMTFTLESKYEFLRRQAQESELMYEVPEITEEDRAPFYPVLLHQVGL